MNNKNCIIKLLDEVNCVLIGLEKDVYQVLYDYFGVFVKNYFFNPKFKLGKWDGKLRFFNHNGKTYINLLPEILPTLKSLGYKFQIIDERTQVKLDIPLIDKDYFKCNGIEFGSHQVEAINAITRKHTGLVVAGTGAGKSLCNAAICDLYNKYAKFKTITIVPTSDLITQTKQAFADMKLDVGEYSGDLKDVNHDHVICTWQSVNNNPTIMGLFKVVICDEAHLATGKSLQKILNEYGSHMPVRIGLTGTVPVDQADALTVKCTLGDVRYVVKAADLIEMGWLADVIIRIMQLKESLKLEWEKYKEINPEEWHKTTYELFKSEVFPDFASERNYLVNKKTRNEFISDIILECRERDKGNCFVLVNSVKQGKKLQELIPNSYFVDGSDSKKIRKQIYDLFSQNNDIVVIATFKLASTGLNIPRIFHLFLIDAGKSFTTIIQSIGRGLRKADDKDKLEAYDICSDLKYAKKHQRQRESYYKDQRYNYTKKSFAYD